MVLRSHHCADRESHSRWAERWFKLKRQTDFHTLLHDAYQSAEETSFNILKSHQPRNDEFTDLPINGELVSTRVSEIRQTSDSRHQSSNANFSSISVNVRPSQDFEEEVVVDRYAAIDAGIEPPAPTSLERSQPADVDTSSKRRDQLDSTSIRPQHRYATPRRTTPRGPTAPRSRSKGR